MAINFPNSASLSLRQTGIFPWTGVPGITEKGSSLTFSEMDYNWWGLYSWSFQLTDLANGAAYTGSNNTFSGLQTFTNATATGNLSVNGLTTLQNSQHVGHALFQNGVQVQSGSIFVGLGSQYPSKTTTSPYVDAPIAYFDNVIATASYINITSTPDMIATWSGVGTGSSLVLAPTVGAAFSASISDRVRLLEDTASNLETQINVIDTELNTVSASYSLSSGSLSTRVTALENFSSSLGAGFVTTSSFNTYTSSLNNWTSSAYTGSVGQFTTTSSFGTYTASINNWTSSVYTGSVDSFTTTSSFNTYTASINNWTSSAYTGSVDQFTTTSSFNTYTASINNWTSSAYTGSVGQFTLTSSFNTFTASYKVDSASFSQSIQNIVNGVTPVKTAETASYISLVAGPGIAINRQTTGLLEVTSSLRTVNGISPVNGNVAVSLAATYTGTSASLQASTTSDYATGSVWVVSGTPGNNGESYILTSGSGTPLWEKLESFDYATADNRYLKLDGANAPMQGAVNFGGYQINNLGIGTLSSDAINLGQLTASAAELRAGVTASLNASSSILQSNIDAINSWTGSVFTGSVSGFTTTSSFNTYTASINNWTSSAYTGSVDGFVTTSSFGTYTASINAWTSSAYTGSVDSFTTTSSFNAYTASINAWTSSAYTGSVDSFTTTSSFNTYTASLNNWTSSAYTGSVDGFATTSSLNAFTASVNATTGALELTTASLNTYTGSMNTWTGSSASIFAGTASYVLTASYISASVLKDRLVAGTNITITEGADTLTIAATGGGGSVNLSAYLSSSWTSSVFDVFAASVNSTTGSLEAATASLYIYTASLNNWTSSAYTGSVGQFTTTSSFGTYTASLNATTGALETATASLYTYTASINAWTSSVYTGSVGQFTTTSSFNTYTASINSWTGSNTSVFAGTASYIEVAQTASYYNETQNLQDVTTIGNQTSASMGITGSLGVQGNTVVTGSLEVNGNANTAYFLPPVVSTYPFTTAPYNTTSVPVGAMVYVNNPVINGLFMKKGQPANWVQII